MSIWMEGKDLTLGYEGIPVVEHLSFVVNQGDYLCIIGENGSGKTTLLKMIVGFLHPMHGEFIRNNTNESIGYLPQQSKAQKDFPASVEEVVLSGFSCQLGSRWKYSKEEKEKAHSYLKELGMEEMAKKSFRDLSGGQQQRVLLARALCANHDYLILDEPITGLDANTTEWFYQLLDNLHKKGTTIIMISHDLQNVEQYASHVLVVNQDSFYGTIDEYKKWKEGGKQ